MNNKTNLTEVRTQFLGTPKYRKMSRDDDNKQDEVM